MDDEQFRASAAVARHGVPLSVLDLVRVSGSVRDAMSESMASAAAAERAGYLRYWFAEHHNTAGVAASATAVLIGQAAANTSRIRVGSGGIMLPNHAPLTVAESFGTLAQLHPDRIDLGLGRAPGTDPRTAAALARSSADPNDFAQSIYDMQGWFSPEGNDHSTGIHSTASVDTDVPIWVLGSTPNGANIAGQLGLPFAVASHFAPDQLEQTIEMYRNVFNPDAPTAQSAEPHLMVGVNVMACETAEEARRQFTTVQQMFAGIRSGENGPLKSPVDDVTEHLSPLDVDLANNMLRVQAVGTPDDVADQLSGIVRSTGADELITVTYAHDPQVALDSMVGTAEVWNAGE